MLICKGYNPLDYQRMIKIDPNETAYLYINEIEEFRYFTIKGKRINGAENDFVTITLEASTQENTTRQEAVYRDITNDLFTIENIQTDRPEPQWNFILNCNTTIYFEHMRLKIENNNPEEVTEKIKIDVSLFNQPIYYTLLDQDKEF